MEIRRKFGIKESSKVEVVEKNGEILIIKCPAFLTYQAAKLEKGNVEELKKMLDQMRDEDD